jgi:hypothetical protein
MLSSAPGMSMGGALGSREVGTNSWPSSRAMAITGTLTRKTEPHQKCSSSQPPVTGPMAMAMPAVADQMAMAWARSFGTVKTLVMIERVAGMTRAAPTPIRARVAISWPALPANALAVEAPAMMRRPRARAPRLPKRSPRAPMVSSRPANTRMYASTIHCSWLAEASSSLRSVGIATFTIVLSTTISSSDKHIVTNTSHCRGCRSTASCPGAWSRVVDAMPVPTPPVPPNSETQ